MSHLELPELNARHHIAWAKRAILLVDIVGSVRLIDQDEVGIISHWLEFVELVQRDILRSNGGQLIKSLGDGLLIDFDDVRSAVAAALSIQEASTRANASRQTVEPILLRMGIEVSDVPAELPDLPASWPSRYERLAAEHDLNARTFPAAVDLVTVLWADLTVEGT